MKQKSYDAFLKSKVKMAPKLGVDIEPGSCSPYAKPHQGAIAEWMVEGGRRACFGAFGIGKSIIQLEVIRMILAAKGGRGLIVLPLNVRHEFIRDATEILKWPVAPKFVRRIEGCSEDGVYVTNYDTVRDGKLDPAGFMAVSLDEAAILRSGGGSKTFREFMRLFTGDGGPCGVDRADGKTVPYRFVATATPSPNDYIELLVYADFLGIMDISQAKTRFFKRDSVKADKLTLHPHKEREFWLWVSSWAIFVQKPSDLGFSDDGYILPEMAVKWREVSSDHKNAGYERSGQGKLLRDAAIGVQDSASEKRNSIGARLEKLLELRAEEPAAHRIIWHDLEIERHAIQKAIPSVVSVFGKQTDLDEREKAILGFSNGDYQELSTKPSIAGAGCNFQRFCHWQIFMGIGFKFHDFIQAIHRLQRYGQLHPVRVDIIYTQAEAGIKKELERKWKQHNNMVKKMTEIIAEFGLSNQAMAKALTRKMGTERVEILGENYRIVNNDCVKESRALPDNSVDLILSSIPFSSQYEYSPNYADFGHSEGNVQFFEQMDYLTPELLRALKPGRLCAIHVKDRIVPGGMTGLGFQTVYPFHLHATMHFMKHGFAYMGMKTVVTDVVRENNQTYRLGWTEQCKDGSKMGVGMPEYLLIFRKPPTDSSNGYADNPVVKRKDRYTRSRWQVDAHGFTRSSGERSLTPEEIVGLKHSEIYNVFRQFNMGTVYDFEHHVRIGEAIDAKGKLPVTFMLLQPQSWHDDVWTDITRMLTLNGAQSAKGKEMHLCPMQFDLADRAIDQWSQPGETVLDPFGGLMTVPYRALLKGRKAIAFELSAPYFLDGAAYCKAAADTVAMPSLFDVLDDQSFAPPELQ